MKRSLLLLCALFALTPPAARADLASDVKKVLQDPFLAHAKFGVELVRLDDGGRAAGLFEDHAATPMVPASNLKIVTTSAAMEKLGADFKFRTLLLRRGQDLVLVGDGDPSFGDAELLKKSGWDVQTVFRAWATALAKANIGPVRRLLVDDSVFDEQFLNPNWKEYPFLERYVSEVGGMNLNFNCADFYIKPNGPGRVVSFITDPPTRYFSVKNSCVEGAGNSVWISRQGDGNEMLLRGETPRANETPVYVTIHDPPMYAGTVLAETLEAAGIHVGAVERDRTVRAAYQNAPSDWTLLAAHQTALTTVMARANKYSKNLYAECCCKRLGYAASGEGSWRAGTEAAGEFLRSIGVPEAQFHLDDGCGLSKSNFITADLMTRVLEHDFYGPNRQTFMDTMAIVGVDGTMEDRFRSTDLRGRVHAKSGFVNDVSCLSGYLLGRDHHWYAFSILFNELPAGGTGQAKAIEERIVHLVDVDE